MRMPPNPPNKARIVGDFIRRRREAVGLSQKALGQLFTPPVTTQFISNVERGVTPLPPVHVSTLARALKTPEDELTYLMEKEYSFRLNSRRASGTHGVETLPADGSEVRVPLWVRVEDSRWLESICAALEVLDHARKEAFRALCAKFLNLPLDSVPVKTQPRSNEPQ